MNIKVMMFFKAETQKFFTQSSLLASCVRISQIFTHLHSVWRRGYLSRNTDRLCERAEVFMGHFSLSFVIWWLWDLSSQLDLKSKNPLANIFFFFLQNYYSNRTSRFSEAQLFSYQIYCHFYTFFYETTENVLNYFWTTIFCANESLVNLPIFTVFRLVKQQK